jgi:hypothetical protein
LESFFGFGFFFFNDTKKAFLKNRQVLSGIHIRMQFWIPVYAGVLLESVKHSGKFDRVYPESTT